LVAYEALLAVWRRTGSEPMRTPFRPDNESDRRPDQREDGKFRVESCLKLNSKRGWTRWRSKDGSRVRLEGRRPDGNASDDTQAVEDAEGAEGEMMLKPETEVYELTSDCSAILLGDYGTEQCKLTLRAGARFVVVAPAGSVSEHPGYELYVIALNSKRYRVDARALEMNSVRRAEE
jgi:hypothetical protein